MAATCGKVAVAEVEELVSTGAIDPDQVHTPGIYIDRIVHCPDQQKRIEQRITRSAS
jgi:acyl CoA:acetate/3-ketoacid CoA transferase alpha subunit